jgi:hypothetical protein
MKNKKGIQLNQAVGAILTLVLIAVLVIVAIFMFTSLGSIVINPASTSWGINESVVPKTSGALLLCGTEAGATCGTISQVWNATTGNINSANYTQTGCVFANTTSYGQPASGWKVNYVCTSAYNAAAGTTLVQFSAYPALIGLVGTIIFLGIVIGVLVASFVFGGKGKA